jgi:carbon storage regulator
MLVLARKLNETIKIGDNIFIKIVSLEPDRVKLGVIAPDHVPVFRTELLKENERPQALSLPGRRRRLN